MKKVLSYLFKGILILIGTLLLGFVVMKIIYSDDVPKGESGEKADELAYNILEAINHDAFTVAKEIHWTFRNVNRYEWQLQENIVNVFWKDFRVTYHTKDKSKSIAYKGENMLTGQERQEALSYAINNFNNDSFWLIAPFKLFDNGTTRSLVQENGKEKLLVQYNSGGSTPGDAYLWEVDEEYQPVAFKMWVSILPFDGLEAKWQDWKMTDGGFLLPQSTSVWGLEIPISEVKVMP